jgi:TnpA family transposase
MEEVCVLTCLIVVNVAKTITTPNANVSAVKTNRGPIGQDRFMPRREFLTAAEREAVLAFPEEEENLLQYHTLSIRDLATVRRHRGGDHNRLGFAVQLWYLHYPGRVLAENETPPAALLAMVAAQLDVQSVYGTSTRGEMRRAASI